MWKIRGAIEQMNEKTLRLKRKQQLIQASLKVRKESMIVNAEFSQVEHDPEHVQYEKGIVKNR
jgi:hypothetical protein